MSTDLAGSGALPALLVLDDAGEGRFRTPVPEVPAEGRDVLYSGQLLAHILMASVHGAAGAKEVRSVHAIFARAGSASAPVDLNVEPLQSGRTWASDTVTASQGERVLCRALVLRSTTDADLMRHQPQPPTEVPDPDDLAAWPGLVFPGAELRPIPGEPSVDGAPVEMAWHRFRSPLASQGASQAVVSWASCGNIIGLAMRPHRDTVRLADAHRTLSTGVIAHTIHFVDRFDAGQWLLIVTEGTHAGSGRVFGTGRIFDAGGRLVAVFEQDAMAKAATGALDPGHGL